jgi:hypothetical protein
LTILPRGRRTLASYPIQAKLNAMRRFAQWFEVNRRTFDPACYLSEPNKGKSLFSSFHNGAVCIKIALQRPESDLLDSVDNETCKVDTKSMFS